MGRLALGPRLAPKILQRLSANGRSASRRRSSAPPARRPRRRGRPHRVGPRRPHRVRRATRSLVRASRFGCHRARRATPRRSPERSSALFRAHRRSRSPRSADRSQRAGRGRVAAAPRPNAASLLQVRAGARGRPPRAARAGGTPPGPPCTVSPNIQRFRTLIYRGSVDSLPQVHRRAPRSTHARDPCRSRVRRCCDADDASRRPVRPRLRLDRVRTRRGRRLRPCARAPGLDRARARQAD